MTAETWLVTFGRRSRGADVTEPLRPTRSAMLTRVSERSRGRWNRRTASSPRPRTEWRSSTRGLVLRCNVTLADILGRTTVEVEGHPLAAFATPEDSTVTDRLSDLRTGHSSQVAFEWSPQRPDGRQVFASVPSILHTPEDEGRRT